MMIAILIAAIVVALVVFSLLCYKKAPPTQAIVVTGFGLSRPKVVCGRGVFVLPVVQRADRLNMRLLKIDVKTPETGVKTKEGVSLWLDSVVTVQVYSENSTVSDEEVRNAGYDDIKKYINSRQQAAISNFLGMDEAHINEKINDVLQGTDSFGETKEKMHVMKTFTPEDVQTYAAMFDKLAEQGVKLCIGSAAEIEKNAEMFDTIVTDWAE